MNRKVLLVVASKGYHPKEYGETRYELEQQGFDVLVASDAAGVATIMPGGARAGLPRYVALAEQYPAYAQCSVDYVLSEVDVTSFAGVFLIGGVGAMELLDTTQMHKILQQCVQQNKAIGAICISPRILARAGVITGKHATGWNNDSALESVFAKYGVVLQPELVVVDGLVVTANGPMAAQGFGKAIVSLLSSMGTLESLQKSCCAH